jgi:hypothetical protein
MSRDPIVDACVYAAVNTHPTISAAGIRYLFAGFALEQIEMSLARLKLLGLIVSEIENGRAVWSVVAADA